MDALGFLSVGISWGLTVETFPTSPFSFFSFMVWSKTGGAIWKEGGGIPRLPPLALFDATNLQRGTDYLRLPAS